LHLGAVKAMERVGNYWHMLPQQNQARKAIWDAVNPHTGKRRIDEAFPLEIRETTREQEMMIRFVNGSTWTVIGSDAYNSLVGAPPLGLVYSEWALSDPNSWAYLRPILRENGGWAAFITTPRGNNHAKRMHEAAERDPDWFAQTLTARETGVFSEADLASEREEYITQFGEDLGEALFAQEYMCSFDAAIVGSYYGREMRKAEEDRRITDVPYDPALEVETWWDLGIRDSTSIWYVQRDPGAVRVIDYDTGTGAGLPEYLQLIQDKPYRYSRHVGPHDIAQREFGTGRTRIEMAEDLGVRFEVAPKLSVQEGINAVRTLLPRCYFDKTKCAEGIDALRNYRTEWDQVNRVMKANPIHDWASHGADAFRTGAVTLPLARASTDWTQPINRRSKTWGANGTGLGWK